MFTISRPELKQVIVACAALLSASTFAHGENSVIPHEVLILQEAQSVDAPIIISTQKSVKTVEIVFALDTTGSMAGLIEGAKSKIWRIINDVMQRQKDKVNVRVGLVAYRDKDDDYVTQVTPLSSDLDMVYGKLMAYQAEGGGDTPEDVRQAMSDAFNRGGWTFDCNASSFAAAKKCPSQKAVSKILFLVGDAPPHDDYAQSISVQKTAQTARAMGIRVNTIQVGDIRETTPVWREVAQYGGGQYFSIAQNGGVRAMVTPYDKKLAELGEKIGSDAVYYGRSDVREKLSVSSMEFTASLKEAPIVAKADRAVNKAINTNAYNSYDLVQAVENNEVRLREIKDDELPETIQGKTFEEKQAYIEGKIAERQSIRKQIAELSAQRNEYLKKHETKGDGFDAAVAEALAKQIN